MNSNKDTESDNQSKHRKVHFSSCAHPRGIISRAAGECAVLDHGRRVRNLPPTFGRSRSVACNTSSVDQRSASTLVDAGPVAGDYINIGVEEGFGNWLEFGYTRSNHTDGGDPTISPLFNFTRNEYLQLQGKSPVGELSRPQIFAGTFLWAECSARTIRSSCRPSNTRMQRTVMSTSLAQNSIMIGKQVRLPGNRWRSRDERAKVRLWRQHRGLGSSRVRRDRFPNSHQESSGDRPRFRDRSRTQKNQVRSYASLPTDLIYAVQDFSSPDCRMELRHRNRSPRREHWRRESTSRSTTLSPLRPTTGSERVASPQAGWNEDLHLRC